MDLYNTVGKYMYVHCSQTASVQILALALANCVPFSNFYTALNLCFLFEKMEVIIGNTSEGCYQS